MVAAASASNSPSAPRSAWDSCRQPFHRCRLVHAKGDLHQGYRDGRDRDRVTPAQASGQGGDCFELRRIVRDRPLVGARYRKPWHEQALRLISAVTVVVAVPALRGNISQVACSQRPRTLNTVRRPAGRPMIDQDELHVRAFLLVVAMVQATFNSLVQSGPGCAHGYSRRDHQAARNRHNHLRSPSRRALK